MIVKPATFEGNRTTWKLEAETSDAAVPRSELWCDGYIHDLPADVEAVWLGLVLAPFARQRLVLPRGVTARLRQSLEAAIGIRVAGPQTVPVESDRAISAREFRAVLARDILDLFLSETLKEPVNYRVAVHADLGQVGEISTSLRIVSNSGSLRRDRAALDGIGELAALLMYGPTLSLRHVASFLCQEEVAAIGCDNLSVLAAECGITLWLPFSKISVKDLGYILVGLGIHPVVCFRGLWNRYQMFPDVVGAIYRDLEHSLSRYHLTDPAIRIAGHFAETHGARQKSHSREFADDAFYRAANV